MVFCHYNPCVQDVSTHATVATKLCGPSIGHENRATPTQQGTNVGSVSFHDTRGVFKCMQGDRLICRDVAESPTRGESNDHCDGASQACLCALV